MLTFRDAGRASDCPAPNSLAQIVLFRNQRPFEPKHTLDNRRTICQNCMLTLPSGIRKVCLCFLKHQDSVSDFAG